MPALTDLDGARRLLVDIRQFAEARTLFQWGVARNDDDAVIGTTTLYHMDERNRRAEIGLPSSERTGDANRPIPGQ